MVTIVSDDDNEKTVCNKSEFHGIHTNLGIEPNGALQAILCAGLYPNVAATEQGIAGVALGNITQSSGLATKGRLVWYDGRREVHIHPSSINGNLNAFQYPFLVFLEKVGILLAMELL